MAARIRAARTSAPAKVRKRVAIRTRAREPVPRRALAKVAAATAGRDFRRWPRAHLLRQDQAGRAKQAGQVNRLAAAKSAVRTALRAVQLRQAVATDRAGHLVRHSI